MDLIILELQGKFAHFRKYYGNNTALSYALPPRTTIMGLLAALLGRERDTYYEEMSSGRLRIGIGIADPIKKSFHRLNNLMIKGDRDFRGRLGPVQTPYEMVMPLDLRQGLVRYRVFLSAHDDGQSLLDEIASCLEHKRHIYNLTLGAAFCHAQISHSKRHEAGAWSTQQAKGELLSLCSAVPIHLVERLVPTAHDVTIEEELLPADFVGNGNRTLKALNKVLFTTSGHPIELHLNGFYHTFKEAGEQYHFTFLENP